MSKGSVTEIIVVVFDRKNTFTIEQESLYLKLEVVETGEVLDSRQLDRYVEPVRAWAAKLWEVRRQFLDTKAPTLFLTWDSGEEFSCCTDQLPASFHEFLLSLVAEGNLARPLSPGTELVSVGWSVFGALFAGVFGVVFGQLFELGLGVSLSLGVMFAVVYGMGKVLEARFLRRSLVDMGFLPASDTAPASRQLEDS